MNKDDVAGLVERLLVPDFYGYQGRKQAEEANTLRQEAADALTTLSAENEALKHDVQRQMAIALEHVNENATLSARVETLEAALRSIAANTCCEPCQEARLVARQALAGDTNHG